MLKNLSIFLTKKRKVTSSFWRKNTKTIKWYWFDCFFSNFFFFILLSYSFSFFLEDGPVQHKKKSFTLNFLVNLHVCLNWFLKIQKNLMESQRFIFLKSITPTFKNYLKNKRSKNPITHIISHILWNHIKNSRLFIFLGIRG